MNSDVLPCVNVSLGGDKMYDVCPALKEAHRLSSMLTAAHLIAGQIQDNASRPQEVIRLAERMLRCNTVKAREELREALAEYAHEAWSGWMKYLFGKTEQTSCGVKIPEWAVERWTRQMNIEYKDLPEEEKKSDREEADRMLKILGGK